MNGTFASSLLFIYVPGTKTPQHSLQWFITHNQFFNLVSFSGESHILPNAAYLAHGWNDSPSGNIISPYLEKIFSALNCSTDTLVNEF